MKLCWPLTARHCTFRFPAFGQGEHAGVMEGVVPIRFAHWYFGAALFASIAMHQVFAQDVEIPPDWLRAKITVEEAERQHPGIPSDDRVAKFPYIAKPFAFQNKQWEAMKADMKPNDQLWEFSSPGPSWKALAGRAGIALVRNGKVIASIVTVMN